MELQGKVAVVTGAASGIGLAAAERFVAEGMSVVMADIEAPLLNEQVARLHADGAAVALCWMFPTRRRLQPFAISQWPRTALCICSSTMPESAELGSQRGRQNQLRGSG